MSQSGSFDYIVIGGGSAGCVVAGRLAEERLGSVLLIESGQSGYENPEVLLSDGFGDAFANDANMWDRMSTLQIHAGKHEVYVGSGKGLGGSGSVNGMVYTRGDRLDFAQWPDNWQWNCVSPAFEKLEQRLGVKPRRPTSFSETCLLAVEKSGFQRKDKLNDGDLCGFMGYNDMNYDAEQRRSSYTSFIHGREQELDLLTIATESTVKRIIFDDQNIATAVIYIQGGKERIAKIMREVIFCAGALESPKLLMLSGVGPAEELRKFDIPVVLDSPGIGQNLQDHPSLVVFVKGREVVDLRYPQVYGFQRFNPDLGLPENQADTCLALMPAGAVMQKTLLRMAPILGLPGKLRDVKLLKNAVRGLINLVFQLPFLNNFVDKIYGVVVILGKPLSRGELKLQSANSEDSALINPAYYKNRADVETMVAGVKKVLEILHQPELENFGNQLLTTAASKDRKAMEKWIRGASVTTFHYCGTCTMGEESSAPVDPKLRVKGLKNVRVADASVMPEVPVSALNAPSMMIGYRAVDFILADAN